MNLHNISSWQAACIVLAFLAVFFMFGMRGYEYIAYTLLFIMVLVIVFNVGSETLRRIVAVITCIGLMYFCVCEIFVIQNCHTDKDPERGYIITLGAAVRGDKPTLALTHRLEATYNYLEEYPESKAVVSGGQGDGENISEAQCMHDWLVEHGINPDRVIMENRSTSTMENLEYSLKLILEDGGSADNIAVVSSPYHLYRAKTMARSIGIEPAGVACVYGYPIFTLGMFIREAFGVTHLWVFGD